MWEYGVYATLAKGRFFDMSKHLKRSVDRFWAATATGYSIDEKYLLAMEESRFDPNDDFENLALAIVEDLIFFFYAVYDKDPKKIFTLCQRQIERLCTLCRLLRKSSTETMILQDTLYRNHLAFAEKLSKITTKEKKEFLDECAKQEYIFPFDKEIAEHQTAQKTENPAKKILPEIRPISLDHEYARKRLLCTGSNPKDMTEEDLLFYGGNFKAAYEERYYCDLCHYMEVSYRLCAERDFLYNRDPERVLGWWYRSAKTTLYSWKLLKKGFPIHFGNANFDLHHEREWRRQHLVMLCAYASGADELLSEICSFENPKGDAKKLLSILTGNVKAQQYELAKPWNNFAHGGEILTTIQEGDEKSFRKCILQMIRSDRKGYEFNPVSLDINAYAYIRLAKEHGMHVQPINAAEVLFGNLDVSIDKSQWKLTYEDEILKILDK